MLPCYSQGLSSITVARSAWIRNKHSDIADTYSDECWSHFAMEVIRQTDPKRASYDGHAITRGWTRNGSSAQPQALKRLCVVNRKFGEHPAAILRHIPAGAVRSPCKNFQGEITDRARNMCLGQCADGAMNTPGLMHMCYCARGPRE